MERRIQILAYLAFIIYVTKASSSCFSSQMQTALSGANSYAQNMKRFLGHCDSDDDLKKPMKSLGRHIEQVIKDIELINIIYQTNSYWIDLRAKIGKFTWTQDNTEPKFMRFETGYPKSHDTDSYCVFLTPHKKWHNGVCNTSRQFVCETDLCY
ncbi:unnamed protein product [Mytilus coruscus]|uniref:C-type lectin domain-containing protein n=1 Tax=Mytilus coruscus TaxID=42192 RepID=A0A6J8EWN3_MYTCO|nr:unnamed protein product [Mytilus coruscus]